MEAEARRNGRPFLTMVTVALVAVVCALIVQCGANASVMLAHDYVGKRRVTQHRVIGWALVVADAAGAIAAWHWAFP